MKLKDLENINKLDKEVILITIIEAKGSVPRNKNVKMVVSTDEQYGTIGGGELEYRTINEAVNLLKNSSQNSIILDYPLGPSLGQCCGGFIKIKLDKFKNGQDLLIENNLKEYISKNYKNLYLFGAGHIAQSLSIKLDGTGFNVFIIDSREDFLSKIKSNYITKILAKNPEIIVNNAPAKTFYLIMTHSHQVDLSICSSLLKKNDFSFIGLIGSKTKKNRFYKRLREMGHKEEIINKIEIPIGLKSIQGKEPDIIAISIIARLLEFKSLKNKSLDYLKLVKG